MKDVGHEDVGHEDVDGGLHEDRRESVDILADDLRSAIDGAKTLLCVDAQLPTMRS